MADFKEATREALEFLRSLNALYKIVPESVTLLNLNSKEESAGNASHIYHLLD